MQSKVNAISGADKVAGAAAEHKFQSVRQDSPASRTTILNDALLVELEVSEDV